MCEPKSGGGGGHLLPPSPPWKVGESAPLAPPSPPPCSYAYVNQQISVSTSLRFFTSCELETRRESVMPLGDEWLMKLSREHTLGSNVSVCSLDSLAPQNSFCWAERTTNDFSIIIIIMAHIRVRNA